MSLIVSIHSYRGGTGKTNLTANAAYQLALKGARVGVVDSDIQSPGIHVLFGLDDTSIQKTLNDFLWGRCVVKDTAHDVTDRVGEGVKGKVFLVPSSSKSGDIARILQEGYDAGLLNDGLQDLVDDLELDALLIDTHPGLNEETMLSMAIADVLLVLLRPDSQDFQGTSVTVEVARKLEVPDLFLVVNKLPEIFNLKEVKTKVEQTYNLEVAEIMYHSEEMMALGSGGLFSKQYPNHEMTAQFAKISKRFMD